MVGFRAFSLSSNNADASIVDVLASLTRLRKISIIYNFTIKSIAPWVALHEMESLNLSACWGLESVNGIEGMKRLKSLQIDSTRISDLSPLLATPILEYADVRTSVSSSLAALVGHRGLRKITVNSDNNSDWASLRELPNLEEIFNDADVRGALTPCPHATAKCTTRHIDD